MGDEKGEKKNRLTSQLQEQKKKGVAWEDFMQCLKILAYLQQDTNRKDFKAPQLTAPWPWQIMKVH